MIDDQAPPQTVAEHLAATLARLGAREAYGVCGREVTAVWQALRAWLTTRHARHETGGVFAAIGSGLASGRPVVAFTTTAPGLTNAITGVEAARVAGVKLVLISPLTPVAERDRLGIQETGPAGVGNEDLHRAGRLFDHVTLLESPEQLPTLVGRLAAGLAGPGGFVAHVAVPVDVQRMPVSAPVVVPEIRRPAPAIGADLADELVAMLAAEPFAVWVGAGARAAAGRVRRLLDLTGAPAITTPRGIGIADLHPRFLGVSGNGGSETLVGDLARFAVTRTLVLGTGLGEASSGWLPELVPPRGFVHVDLDATVFGRAYPQAPTLGVQAGVAEVLDVLLARADRFVHRPAPRPVRRASERTAPEGTAPGAVHPVALMRAIQRVVVDGSSALVFADAASAMFLAARHLTFATPGRLQIEPHIGAMGMAGAAAVGAASAGRRVAVAIVGDGAMHMQDEINTAVRYGLRVVWVVLNDDGLGVVRHGMRRNGHHDLDTDYPPTDFAAVARAKGAQGIRTSSPSRLDRVLRRALAAGGPFLVDVLIDRSAVPPLGARGAR